MQQLTEQDVIRIIKQQGTHLFSNRLTGDVPTEANQLANKKYVDNKTPSYVGKVKFDGTALTPFPSGWSVVRNGNGDYTITHNLGTLNYGVVVTPADNPANNDTKFCQITARNTNNVNITFADTVPVLHDASFYFILQKT